MKFWVKVARTGIVVCTSAFLIASWMLPNSISDKIFISGLILIVPFILWTLLAVYEDQ